MDSALITVPICSSAQDEIIHKLLETAKNISSTKEELYQEYVLWDANIEETISALQKIHKGLKKHSFNSNCAILSGASATILGSIAGIVGIALTPVTAGASLALTAGGTALASTGGIVSVGSNIASHYLIKNLSGQANNIFDKNINSSKNIEKLINDYNHLLRFFRDLMDQLEEQYRNIIRFVLQDSLRNVNPSVDIEGTRLPTVYKMEEMKPNGQILRSDLTITKCIFELIKYIMKDPNLQRIVQDFLFSGVTEGVVPALLRNVSNQDVLKLISETSRLFQFALKEVGMTMRIGLSVLNAVFLVWGMVELVNTSIQIHHGSETDQSKEIGKVVANLETYRCEIRTNAEKIFFL